MAAYILRRLLLMIPTLFGIMLITFSVTQFVPGGPVERMMAEIEGHAGSIVGSPCLDFAKTPVTGVPARDR